jgi:hypothetical protein
MLEVVTQFHQSEPDDRLKADNSFSFPTNDHKSSKPDINAPDFTPGMQSNQKVFNREEKSHSNKKYYIEFY